MIQQILRNVFLCKLFAWRGKLDLQLNCSAIDNVRKNAIYLQRKFNLLGLSINFSASKSCSFFFSSSSFNISLCVLVLHNEPRCSCPILPYKYVLTLCKQEKDHSTEALEIAMTQGERVHQNVPFHLLSTPYADDVQRQNQLLQSIQVAPYNFPY